MGKVHFKGVSEIRRLIMLEGELKYDKDIVKLLEGPADIQASFSEKNISFTTTTSQCRENIINSLSHIFKQTKFKKTGRQTERIDHFPDFNKGHSCFIYGVPRPQTIIDADEFLLLVEKIVGTLMSVIHGKRKGFDLEIGIGELANSNHYSVNETKGKEAVTIKFPNIFLSSPASLSIFMAMARKAIFLIELFRTTETITTTAGATTTKTQIESAEKYINYLKKTEVDPKSDDFKQLIICLNGNGRDPLYLQKRTARLTEAFPIEFMLYNLGLEGKGVFNKGLWEMGANGYVSSVNLCYNYQIPIYLKDGEVKKTDEIAKGFRDYLTKFGDVKTIKLLCELPR